MSKGDDVLEVDTMTEALGGDERDAHFNSEDNAHVVSGPTQNKALFKELVAPPGDFSLMVPVCSLVI